MQKKAIIPLLLILASLSTLIFVLVKSYQRKSIEGPSPESELIYIEGSLDQAIAEDRKADPTDVISSETPPTDNEKAQETSEVNSELDSLEKDLDNMDEGNLDDLTF